MCIGKGATTVSKEGFCRGTRAGEGRERVRKVHVHDEKAQKYFREL